MPGVLRQSWLREFSREYEQLHELWCDAETLIDDPPADLSSHERLETLEKVLVALKPLDTSGRFTDDGQTLLTAAARSGNVDVVALLLRHGVDVEARSADDAGRLTPVIVAASNGDTAILRALLKAGCRPYSSDDHGASALHYAARLGEVESVQTLLEHGLSANMPAGDGCTPLGEAACFNRREVARLLLEHGAEIDARNVISHETPLHDAALNGFHEMVSLLLHAGADATARCMLVGGGEDDRVTAFELLLDVVTDPAEDTVADLVEEEAEDEDVDFIATLRVLRAQNAWLRRRHAISAYHRMGSVYDSASASGGDFLARDKAPSAAAAATAPASRSE